MDELEAIAWRDLKSDCVFVRVREYRAGTSGKKIKRGVIIKMTDEIFSDVAEGMEYPQRTPESFVKETRKHRKPKTINPVNLDQIRWTRVSDTSIDKKT